MTYSTPPFDSEPTAYSPQYAGPLTSALKHSGLGIASFIISLLTILGECILCAAATVIVAKAGPGSADAAGHTPAMMTIGLLLFAGMGFALIGVVLGIIGACLPNRKKVFAYIGMALNAAVLLGVIGLMVIGLVSKT